MAKGPIDKKVIEKLIFFAEIKRCTFSTMHYVIVRNNMKFVM